MKSQFEDIKNHVQQFRDVLFNFRKLQKAVSEEWRLPIEQLDIATIEHIVSEYESELQEFTELQEEWDKKQVDLQALKREGTRLLHEAEKLKIETDDDYVEAQKLQDETQRNLNILFAKVAPLNTLYGQKYKRLIKLKNRITSHMIVLQETLNSIIVKRRRTQP